MKIFVFPNIAKAGMLENVSEIIKFIESKNCEVLMLAQYRELFSQSHFSNVKFVFEEEISKASLVLVIGGDGTILRAARIASENNIPILAVNTGHIGYMSTVEFSQYSLIDIFLENSELLKDPRFVETRMMLDCAVSEDGKTTFCARALNDISVSKGALSRMIDISLKNCGAEISRYRADGLIVSTPTGSTAYSMSAGGPIVDPAIECICMTPVCPYMAKNRSPIIFSSDSDLCIEFNLRDDDFPEAYITIDGYESFKLSQNSKISISKSDKSLKLIRIKETHFYELLHLKMS